MLKKFTYDKLYRRTQLHYPNGAMSTYLYDDIGKSGGGGEDSATQITIWDRESPTRKTSLCIRCKPVEE